MGWFLLLNLSLLHTLQANAAVINALPRLYLFVALFSLGVFAVGVAGFHNENCYAARRVIIGAVQPIVPVLSILPVSRSGNLTKKQRY